MRTLVMVGLVTTACTTPPQALTGRVAPGFPTTITSVKILRGGSVVASAPVAVDGTFQLSVPPNGSLSLHLVGNGESGLMLPRHSGSIDPTFAIRPGGVSFNLGAIYFVGTAAATRFAFYDTHSVSGQCDAGDKDSTGATCIDDGDIHRGVCSGDDTSSGGTANDPGDGANDGDAISEHNFPADGCADGDDNGGDFDDDGDDGSGSDT